MVVQGDGAAWCGLSVRALNKTLGPHHPDVAKSLNNFAIVLKAQVAR